MKNMLWGLAFGVLFGLLAAGMLLLVARQPEGETVRLSPPPTPLPLVVHVTGAVVRPGLFRLSPGSRVQDAITAAGGFAAQAEESGLNLAAQVQDGDLIRVLSKPVAGAAPAGTAPAIQPPARSGGIEASTAGMLVDINTASAEELEELPGIGPVTAQKIVDYRAEHGSFATIAAIQDVPGIGPATFEKIQDLITAGAGP